MYRPELLYITVIRPKLSKSFIALFSESCDMKKEWLLRTDIVAGSGSSIENKVDCATFADYKYNIDHKVKGADWDDSDNTCTIFFNDEDAFVGYLDDVGVAQVEAQTRWRCLNRKKY